MRRRLEYYVLRTRRLLRQQGPLVAATELWGFLWRHWFLLQFGWHWFEFNVVAPRRRALATIRRVTDWSPTRVEGEGGHVLLFASFDPLGEVQAHVVAQLAAYHAIGFRTVFVTTSPSFDLRAEAAVRPYCLAALHRRNVGIDFGSWLAAYEWLHGIPGGAELLSTADSALLANDSCYGPFHPMGPFLEHMRAAPEVVYGITRSLEIRPYLQSYFLHFGRALVARGVFRAFMTECVRLLGTKAAVARFLEVGGSAFLDARGVELRALVDAAVEPARSILARHDLLDPIRDPAGREFLELGLTPFHKRSNDRTATPSLTGGCLPIR